MSQSPTQSIIAGEEWTEVKAGWAFVRQRQMFLGTSWTPRWLVVYQRPVASVVVYEQKGDARPPYTPLMHLDLSLVNVDVKATSGSMAPSRSNSIDTCTSTGSTKSTLQKLSEKLAKTFKTPMKKLAVGKNSLDDQAMVISRESGEKLVVAFESLQERDGWMDVIRLVQSEVALSKQMESISVCSPTDSSASIAPAASGLQSYGVCVLEDKLLQSLTCNQPPHFSQLQLSQVSMNDGSEEKLAEDLNIRYQMLLSERHACTHQAVNRLALMRTIGRFNQLVSSKLQEYLDKYHHQPQAIDGLLFELGPVQVELAVEYEQATDQGQVAFANAMIRSELLSLQWLNQQASPVHSTMMTCLEYKGFRVLAYWALPISPDTLMLREVDNEPVIVTEQAVQVCRELADQMHFMADYPNRISGRPTCLHTGIEVHAIDSDLVALQGEQAARARSLPRGYYLCALADLLPVCGDGEDAKRLRPEFIQHYYHTTGQSLPNSDNFLEKSATALKYLAGPLLDALVGDLESLQVLPVDSIEWTELLHSRGINCALYGLLHGRVSLPHIKEHLLVEMAARTLKAILADQLRAAISHFKQVQAMKVEQELKLIVMEWIDELAISQRGRWIDELLIPAMERKFKIRVECDAFKQIPPLVLLFAIQHHSVRRRGEAGGLPGLPGQAGVVEHQVPASGRLRPRLGPVQRGQADTAARDGGLEGRAAPRPPVAPALRGAPAGQRGRRTAGDGAECRAQEPRRPSDADAGRAGPHEAPRLLGQLGPRGPGRHPQDRRRGAPDRSGPPGRALARPHPPAPAAVAHPVRAAGQGEAVQEQPAGQGHPGRGTRLSAGSPPHLSQGPGQVAPGHPQPAGRDRRPAGPRRRPRRGDQVVAGGAEDVRQGRRPVGQAARPDSPRPPGQGRPGAGLAGSAARPAVARGGALGTGRRQGRVAAARRLAGTDRRAGRRHPGQRPAGRDGHRPPPLLVGRHAQAGAAGRRLPRGLVRADEGPPRPDGRPGPHQPAAQAHQPAAAARPALAEAAHPGGLPAARHGERPDAGKGRHPEDGDGVVGVGVCGAVPGGGRAGPHRRRHGRAGPAVHHRQRPAVTRPFIKLLYIRPAAHGHVLFIWIEAVVQLDVAVQQPVHNALVLLVLADLQRGQRRRQPVARQAVVHPHLVQDGRLEVRQALAAHVEGKVKGRVGREGGGRARALQAAHKGVREGVVDRYAVGRLELEHPVEQVDRVARRIREAGRDRVARVRRQARQVGAGLGRRHLRHLVGRRRAELLDDQVQLVDAGLPGQEDAPAQQLGEDAPHRPHVHYRLRHMCTWLAVPAARQQDLRRAVPAGGHVCGHGAVHAVHRLAQAPRQPKVAQLPVSKRRVPSARPCASTGCSPASGPCG